MSSVTPPRVVNIADLRRVAQQRLPRVIFDYIDGGADQELTMRRNVAAIRSVASRAAGSDTAPPNPPVDGAAVELSTAGVSGDSDTADPRRLR